MNYYISDLYEYNYKSMKYRIVELEIIPNT